jgi:hypothetical protein
MKMNEVASAEEQLALWKLINQSVWAALEQQRAEQQRAAQWKKAQDAAKPKTGKRVKPLPFTPLPIPAASKNTQRLPQPKASSITSSVPPETRITSAKTYDSEEDQSKDKSPDHSDDRHS